MKQVAGLISTYSSDEFGICSALYELGGMVVMHDASGCNSTYTTHDEPRWYDMDSMIYISAISEMEAIMGDDEKLIHDIIETAKEMKPKFIAIVGAPIPYMIGTDLKAIASIVEEELQIPSFGFEANGMNGYLTGMSMAFEALVDRFCVRDIQRKNEKKVNIIGATPLDFSLNGSLDSIKEWIKKIGLEPGACFAMGDSLHDLEMAGDASVNLVISYGGYEAAKKMKELFDIPYVTGVPIGSVFSKVLEEKIKDAIKTGENQITSQLQIKDAQDKQKYAEKKIVVIGESIYATSLATAIEQEYGMAARVLCPLETTNTLLRKDDIQTIEEDDLIVELRKEDINAVIADPLYQPIIPDGVKFYPLGHIAFSGRIYENEIPNLIGQKLVKQQED